MDNNTPTVVKIHDVNIDKDYINWIEELKSRYRSAQIKAAVKVNAEKLHFNWELGRDLVIRKAEERWGSGVVEQLSLDLQVTFPESKGFSASNLWRMKQWYQFYCNEAGKLAQVARENSHKLREKISMPTTYRKRELIFLISLPAFHGVIILKSSPNAKISMSRSSIF